jgi:hypothetical protein
MAIIITVNGSKGPEGFLVAPSGTHEFPVAVGLKTDNGTTVQATLGITASPGVNVQLSQTSVTIGPTQKSVKIVAKSASKKAGDIKLAVKVGAAIKATFTLTALPQPRLRFTGRFQARFATDGDFFNEPRGTSAGWTWALEGEPDFVPPANNVPTQPGMAVGRVVRFQNAVAPRPRVDPIGVKVTAVEADIGGKTVSFTSGDPVIGQQVSLGPNTYLAANEPIPAGPQPFETYNPGFEPIENFELHIGSSFSGQPAALSDRPKANGFFALTAAQLTQYGIVPLNTFSSQRKTALLNDYHQLSPSDRTGTAAGRNLATRISHLGGSAPDNIPASQATLPFGWGGQETYNGILNSAIQITPGKSAVLAYFKFFTQFRYSGMFFNFHSDELCGRMDGTLAAFTRTLQRLFEPNS